MYKNKYFKYKNKYLNLKKNIKNQIAGTPETLEELKKYNFFDFKTGEKINIDYHESKQIICAMFDKNDVGDRFGNLLIHFINFIICFLYFIQYDTEKTEDRYYIIIIDDNPSGDSDSDSDSDSESELPNKHIVMLKKLGFYTRKEIDKKLFDKFIKFKTSFNHLSKNFFKPHDINTKFVNFYMFSILGLNMMLNIINKFIACISSDLRLDKYKSSDDKVTISVHFRMSDYCTGQNTCFDKIQNNINDVENLDGANIRFPILGFKYYIDSLDEILRKNNGKKCRIILFYYKTFIDEQIIKLYINIIKIRFKDFDLEIITEYEYIESSKANEISLIFTASLSDYIIMSNSTFGYFMCYFNIVRYRRYENVYCPDKPFYASDRLFELLMFKSLCGSNIEKIKTAFIKEYIPKKSNALINLYDYLNANISALNLNVNMLVLLYMQSDIYDMDFFTPYIEDIKQFNILLKSIGTNGKIDELLFDDTHIFHFILPDKHKILQMILSFVFIKKIESNSENLMKINEIESKYYYCVTKNIHLNRTSQSVNNDLDQNIDTVRLLLFVISVFLQLKTCDSISLDISFCKFDILVLTRFFDIEISENNLIFKQKKLSETYTKSNPIFDKLYKLLNSISIPTDTNIDKCFMDFLDEVTFYSEDLNDVYKKTTIYDTFTDGIIGNKLNDMFITT